MKTYRHTLPTNGIIEGRYRIQGVLGEGGFGITYRAWDERLERLVVIKEYLPGDLGVRDGDTLAVLPREQREDEFQYGLNKYMDEAKALAKFRHPNIVRIIDHLEAFGTAYIVMEYEEGETLAEHLKRRSDLIGEEEILALIVPLLQGLLEIHNAGLLHRDIKPGNIFIRETGEPLLIDFGAARHELGGHSRSVSAIVTGGYAPPEQYVTRSNQGPHTDLYAMGAVLYELISGVTPPESVGRSHRISDGEADPLIPSVEVGEGRISEWLLRLDDYMLRLPSKERPQDCAEVLAEIQLHYHFQGEVLSRQPADDGQGPYPKTRMVSEEERFSSTTAIQPRWNLNWNLNSVLNSVLDSSLSLLNSVKEWNIQGIKIWPALALLPVLLVGGVLLFWGSSSDVNEGISELVGSDSQVEASQFIIASEIDTIFAYQLFLRKYPDGHFSQEAHKRFNR